MSHPSHQAQDDRFRFSPTPIRKITTSLRNQRRIRYKSVPPQKSCTQRRPIAITAIITSSRTSLVLIRNR